MKQKISSDQGAGTQGCKSPKQKFWWSIRQANGLIYFYLVLSKSYQMFLKNRIFLQIKLSQYYSVNLQA